MGLLEGINKNIDSRYLKCPLCSRTGGAMKQTTLLMKESFLETLNPDFHQYAIAHFVEEQPLFNDSDSENNKFYYDY
jgi:hypothetical protein